MFEDSEVKEKYRPPSFWLKIVVAVAVTMIVINAFRVNPPEQVVNEPNPVVEDTKGVFVREPVIIEPDGFVPYRISFPYRSTLKGTFRTRERGDRILVLVLDEANHVKYRDDDEEFTTLISTSRVPSGKINRKLEAGTYYLIFDNREGTSRQIVDADFLVE